MTCQQTTKPKSLKARKATTLIGGPRVMQLFIEMYSVFVVSAATPRHLPIVWGKNTENITIAKIFKATTYLTSNRG
jgi:hypothetical protein